MATTSPQSLSTQVPSGLKSIWLVGGTYAEAQEFVAVNPTLAGTNFLHIPLEAWQQRYAARPISDSHNSGSTPSTEWIGMRCVLLVCVRQLPASPV